MTLQSPIDPQPEPLSRSQYLIFTLAGERFAIDIQHIREIIEYTRLTEVPMVPGYVRGVINLRGAVVPVLDLQLRFGRGQTQRDRRTCIVIMEVPAVHEGGPPQVIGVMVGAVNEVVEIPPGDIEPPPQFGAGVRQDFVLGMGKLAGAFVILLRPERVMSFDEPERVAQSLAASLGETLVA